MTDTDFPKRIRVGGREYEISPESSIDDIVEVQQSFMNEAQKLVELQLAMGLDVDEEVLKEFGFERREER